MTLDQNSADLRPMMSSPRVLARNIGFTEGPIWTGTEIVVTSITRGLLYAMTLAGGDVAAVAEPGGGPNGLTYDPASGRVWIAQNGRVHMPPRAAVPDRAAGIQSWLPGEDVVAHVEEPRWAPNDCVVGPDGRLWFSNPSGDPHKGEPQWGSVCALDPSSGDVDVLWHTDGYPNGLAFGAEPDRLFLAETRYSRVVELRYVRGSLTRTGRTAVMRRGHPDGIAVSAQGPLLVAGTGSGALEVYDAALRHAGSVDLGAASMPTNVCFAGAELDKVVVTLAKGGRVVVLDSDLQGLPLDHRIGTPTAVAHATSTEGGRR